MSTQVEKTIPAAEDEQTDVFLLQCAFQMAVSTAR